MQAKNRLLGEFFDFITHTAIRTIEGREPEIFLFLVVCPVNYEHVSQPNFMKNRESILVIYYQTGP